MSNVPNSMGKTAEVIRLLRLELGNYSIETIKSAIAQSSLNAEQIKAILSAKGLRQKSKKLLQPIPFQPPKPEQQLLH